MKFFYNMAKKWQVAELNQLEENREYFTEEMIRQIPVYPWSQKLEEEWLSDNSNLWPVEPAGSSRDQFFECESAEEARREMFYRFNNSLYEQYHDL